MVQLHIQKYWQPGRKHAFFLTRKIFRQGPL